MIGDMDMDIAIARLLPPEKAVVQANALDAD